MSLRPKNVPSWFSLDYLREYSLEGPPATTRRNVPLVPSPYRRRLPDFDGSTFGWRLTRRLEGTDDSDCTTGVWPLNAFRIGRQHGDPGNDLFPRGTDIDGVKPETWRLAKQMRLFCYHRVPSAVTARDLLSHGLTVSLSLEVTEGWYDPPGGKIPPLPSNPDFRGSHAVPLHDFDYRTNSFAFLNSWGREWGDEGRGYLPYEDLDRSVIEAWLLSGNGFYPPLQAQAGIVCLVWKWSPHGPSLGVHGLEIVDAATEKRMAWAFCVRRDGFLDVDEFFVWPDERRKGFGRRLAGMVSVLAHALRSPLRMWVSFADTEPSVRELTTVAARLLGLKLGPSPLRWADLVGLSSLSEIAPRTRRPIRPASILELLRSRDEKPVEEPIEVTVLFGTNRKRLSNTSISVQFTNQRDDELHVGTCTVAVPKAHHFGSAGKRWFGLWPSAAAKSLSLKSISCFSDEEFLKAAGKLLAKFDDKPQNLLYVHGYRVSFEDAAIRAAQLSYDLKIPGATFFYSWPSAANFRSYAADETSIEASLPHLEFFVKMILTRFPEVPLNVIVHSMGNRAILRVMERLATDGKETRFGQVILAAPDVDSTVFRNSVKSIGKLYQRLSLYATRADWALQASEWLHGYPRAGLAPPITVVPGVDTILVENFDLLDLGHGYYAEAAPLLHDIFHLICHDTPPNSRPETQQTNTEDGQTYWRISLG